MAPPEGAGVDVDGAGPDVEGAGADVDGDGAPPASCAIAGPAISAVAHNATAVAKAKAGYFMPSPILSAFTFFPTGEHRAGALSMLHFCLPQFVANENRQIR